MPARTIAIGDIHGCTTALAAVLQAIVPQPDDEIVLLGDYVDRGPDSRGVIDLLLEWQARCRMISLLGNHEIMMLAALDSLNELRFWLQCGGMATLDSYGGDLESIPESHLAFLRGLRTYYETDRQLFFHANYDPRLPPQQQPDHLLFWQHLLLHPSGRHTIPGPHYSGKTAFVGHSPQESGQILDLDHVVCIDTYCVGTGCLTALEVNTRQSWRATKTGQLLEG
jgi:serine/threonine protein phosphatase 1